MPFFGRSRELALLLAEIEKGAGLCTIVGPSGIGKTRLARQLMRRLVPLAGEGTEVVFCSLVTCRNEADVQGAVASSLGISQRQGLALASAIGQRGPLVLILDNVDQLAPATGPLVETWLDHAASLQVVATTLLPLGIEEETTFELGPLELDDAVALYFERAGRVSADRPLVSADDAIVRELVGRLDRIPLAIELAAARVRVLPPKAILHRIDERFGLLRSPRAGRHGSLLDALTLTWELLTPAEQTTLARASVFVGGFDQDAAEAVLGADDVLVLLEGLRSKALVQLDTTDPHRFTLYEAVREFAALRLSEDPDEGIRAEDAHLAFYSLRGEREAASSTGPDGAQAIAWLSRERENLSAALGRGMSRNPTAATKAGLALATVLSLQGPPSTEVHVLDQTVEASRHTHDPLLLVEALRTRALAHKRQGRNEEALADQDEALQLATAHGASAQRGFLLVDRAAVRVQLGEAEVAVAHIDEAIRVGRERGDLLLEGFALLVHGAIEWSRSEVEAGCRLFAASLTIFRQIGHVRFEGAALMNLGAAWSGSGRFWEARHALEEAIHLFQRYGNLASEIHALINLGNVELAAGRLDEAEAHFLVAMAKVRKLGNRRSEAFTVGSLGVVALEKGDLHLAHRHLGQAIFLHQEMGERRFASVYLAFLAVTDALLGQLGEASRLFQEARREAGSAADPGLLALFQTLEGFLDPVGARAQGGAGALRPPGIQAGAVAPPERGLEELFVARRLLEAHLRRLSDADPLPVAPPRERLTIGYDGAWFAFTDQPRVDLRRRTAIRRMLEGLAAWRLQFPGTGLGLQEIFEIGWPGESIHPDSAATRVYSGIRTLRSLGLAAVLQRQADGYLLDPEFPVSRETKKPTDRPSGPEGSESWTSTGRD